MYLHILDHTLWFPPVEEALPDGLLAAGGDLSAERLLLAYKSGIFPWYSEDDPPLWWSPDPRFVLFPDEIKVSRSMKQVFNNETFVFTADTAFEDVINNCKKVKRRYMDGTWINDDIVTAYTDLYRSGYVHTAEAWKDGWLVGGLYGVRLGNCFFGESMFSTVTNASKFAFINYVKMLGQEGVVVIDCQVYTRHLESLGARMIPRIEFLNLINPG